MKLKENITKKRVVRVGLRVLTVLTVVWGTLSAAVLFAVRYDLLPGEDDSAHAAIPTQTQLDRPWPRLDAEAWPSFAWQSTVDSALRVFSMEIGANRQRVELAWERADSTGAVIVHVLESSCGCPYDRTERWNYARITLHPHTGEVLASDYQTAVATAELRKWGLL